MQTMLATGPTPRREAIANVKERRRDADNAVEEICGTNQRRRSVATARCWARTINDAVVSSREAVKPSIIHGAQNHAINDAPARTMMRR